MALAAISTLSIALLSSIWTPDVSGSLAVLGLLSVYLASQEFLVLYLVFTPASIIVDIIRLSMVNKGMGGRAWLIFFAILEMVCKGAGTVFAWSLHRSVTTGEGTYQPMNHPSTAAPATYARVEDPFQAAYAPPRMDGQGPPPYQGQAPQGPPPASGGPGLA